MTKPDFEKMARDFVLRENDFYSVEELAKEYAKAYAAGRADERGRCAKIADDEESMARLAVRSIDTSDGEKVISAYIAATSKAISNAIRSGDEE